jgi:hypothetical protein
MRLPPVLQPIPNPPAQRKTIEYDFCSDLSNLG